MAAYSNRGYSSFRGEMTSQKRVGENRTRVKMASEMASESETASEMASPG